MSCTEIYSFNKEGNAVLSGEVNNSWSGAMTVWSFLEKKYLPPYIPNYAKCCNWYKPGMTSEEVACRIGYEPSRISEFSGRDMPIKEVWDLADNKDIPEYERIVLFTTFDKCLVKKEDIPKVITAFRKFEAETNLKEQAGILEELFNDEDCIAVGWNQNSINRETWENIGEYDEENEEIMPYNCLIQDKHYWLFDEI